MTHSWLAIAALALVSSATSVLGQQQSEDHQFNITSPITNGVYVAGQTLPCTYRLDDSTPGKAVALLLISWSISFFSN